MSMLILPDRLVSFSRSIELLVVWGGVFFFFLVTGDVNLMTITWHDPSCFLAQVPAPTRF